MKSVKQLVSTLLFVSALVVNTYAGDVETPGFVPPPPPPPPHSMRTIAATEGAPESEVIIPGDASASDQIFYEALMALLSLY
jgi:hypothetical protein